MAFVVDAASFAVSAATLLFIAGAAGARRRVRRSPLAAIGEGLKYALSRPVFRWIVGLIAAANLLLIGPLLVGVPVLAQTRFSQGAAAFGLLISAYGLGNLCGIVVGGTTAPRPSRMLLATVLALFAGFGVVIGALTFITSVWVGVALLAVLGVANGYVAIVLMTLLQRITPPAMLGRLMSLVMLAMLGVTPISTALSGVVVGLGPAVLFVGCGAGMLAVTAFAAAGRHSWSLAALEAGEMPVMAESA